MSSLLRRSNYCINELLGCIVALSLIGVPASLLTTHALARAQASRIVSLTSAATNSMIRPGPDVGALPLNFELNQGQTNEQVKFLARSAGYLLFLTATESVMVLENPAAHRRGKENRETRGITDYQELDESRAKPHE